MKAKLNIFTKILILCTLVLTLIFVFCFEDDDFNIPTSDKVEMSVVASATGKITQDGGFVNLSDNSAKLIVPPESIADDKAITLNRLKGVPVPKNENLIPIDLSFELSPDGTCFHKNKPAKLTVYYNDKKLPKGVNENTIRLYHYDPETEEYNCVGGEIDTANNSLTAEIKHFSYYIPLAFNSLIDLDQKGPIIGGPSFYPEKLRNQQLRMYFQVYDHDNLVNPDTQNGIANVEVYWEVAGKTDINETVRAERDRTYNDRYYIDIPHDIITRGNDVLNYSIIARDNLNLANNRNGSITGFDRIQSNSYEIIPNNLNITGGFKRLFRVRGRLVGKGNTVWLSPDSWSVEPVQLGTIDENDVFTAGAAGAGTVKAHFADGRVISASVFVDAGEIEEIAIVYESTSYFEEILGNDGYLKSGDIVNNIELMIDKYDTIQFGAVAIDKNDNIMSINANWSYTNNLGSLETLGPNAGRLDTSTSICGSKGALTVAFAGKTAFVDIVIGSLCIYEELQPHIYKTAREFGPIDFYKIKINWMNNILDLAAENKITLTLLNKTDGYLKPNCCDCFDYELRQQPFTMKSIDFEKELGLTLDKIENRPGIIGSMIKNGYIVSWARTFEEIMEHYQDQLSVSATDYDHHPCLKTKSLKDYEIDKFLRDKIIPIYGENKTVGAKIIITGDPSEPGTCQFDLAPGNFGSGGLYHMCASNYGDMAYLSVDLMGRGLSTDLDYHYMILGRKVAGLPYTPEPTFEEKQEEFSKFPINEHIFPYLSIKTDINYSGFNAYSVVISHICKAKSYLPWIGDVICTLFEEVKDYIGMGTKISGSFSMYENAYNVSKFYSGLIEVNPTSGRILVSADLKIILILEAGCSTVDETSFVIYDRELNYSIAPGNWGDSHRGYIY